MIAPNKSLLRQACDDERLRRNVTAPRTVADRVRVLRTEIETIVGTLKAFRRELDFLELVLPAQDPALGGDTLDEIPVIQHVVGQYFKFTPEELIGRGRPEDLAWARHVAVYLCKLFTGKPHVQIGEGFGGRDHGTICNSIRAVEDAIRTDKTRRAQIAYLKEVLRQKLPIERPVE